MMLFDLLETAPTETKTIITYKLDGNTIKTVKKDLVNLASLFNDNNIIGMFADATETRRNGITIYKDFSLCWKVQTIYSDTEAEKMHIALIRYCQGMRDYNDFCEMIQNTINAGGYIQNDSLYLLQIHGNTELLQNALQVKEGIKASIRAEEKEKARREEEETRRREEAEKAEADRRKVEKLEFLCGYADGKTQIQIERLYTTLSKKYIYDGKCKTRKDFIIDTLAEGGRVECKEGVISYYGSKWDIKKSKPKTEYRLYTADGSFYTVTKTEYDFAVYIMGKSA